MATAANLAGGCLYALLKNSHVHVWELHLSRPPVFMEAWTHLEHERCCSMAFFDGGLVDAAMAAKLGISVRAAASAAVVSADGSKHTFNSGQGPDMQSAAGNCQHNSSADSGSNGVSEFVVEDHVLFGTAKGEVLFCDASRGGLVVLRMPALE
eukprot:GHRR01032816.1.p1 GENE.GHRR01032816.1~~GHRR01032816.1.p1  ORF type:complete len:153 (+),score=66.14 GHRR01032816.1:613-1071(+)